MGVFGTDHQVGRLVNEDGRLSYQPQHLHTQHLHILLP